MKYKKILFIPLCLISLTTHTVDPIPLDSVLLGLFANVSDYTDIRKVRVLAIDLLAGKKTTTLRQPFYTFLILEGPEKSFIVWHNTKECEIVPVMHDHHKRFVHKTLTAQTDENSLLHNEGPFTVTTLDPVTEKIIPIGTISDNVHEQLFALFDNNTNIPKHTIRSFAKIEAASDLNWYEEHEQVADNDTVRDQLDINHAHTKDILRAFLEIFKREFDKKVAPFMQKALNNKQQTISLIEKSCTNHDRPDSPLLHWAESKKGQEMHDFHKNVTTFAKLDEFFTDLIIFLNDMLESFPEKVKQQYTEIVQQHKESQNKPL